MSPAVFTRNHMPYLSAAVKRNRRDPSALTSFRSEVKWTAAARMLATYHRIPAYIAVIGGPKRVAYSGILEHVELSPDDRKVSTRRWTKYALPSTANERDWSRGEGTVYVLSHVRSVTPFPITSLILLAKGRSISHTYRYSYALVQALAHDALATDPVGTDVSDENPPSRKTSVVTRIVRDTVLVRSLKALHRDRCQICRTALELSAGRYSEGHHLQPLGGDHRGPDTAGNIIIVCPNHHALLDFRAMPLSRRALRGPTGHTISKKYLDYHNSLVGET